MYTFYYPGIKRETESPGLYEGLRQAPLWQNAEDVLQESPRSMWIPAKGI